MKLDCHSVIGPTKLTHPKSWALGVISTVSNKLMVRMLQDLVTPVPFVGNKLPGSFTTRPFLINSNLYTHR